MFTGHKEWTTSNSWHILYFYQIAVTYFRLTWDVHALPWVSTKLHAVVFGRVLRVWGFFWWFFLYLVCISFQVNWLSFTLFFANLCISFSYFFLGCSFRTVQIVAIVCCLFIDCAAWRVHFWNPADLLFKGNKCLFPYYNSTIWQSKG